MSRPVSSPVGLHRVLEPAGESLPQAACRLDATSPLWPDEARVSTRLADDRRRTAQTRYSDRAQEVRMGVKKSESDCLHRPGRVTLS